jgi:hypothetical protein
MGNAMLDRITGSWAMWEVARGQSRVEKSGHDLSARRASGIVSFGDFLSPFETKCIEISPQKKSIQKIASLFHVEEIN